MKSSRARRALDRLLDERNEHPERLVDIDRRIHMTLGRELAVLVLDMCGFSRLTQKHGITHYLAMIRRMHLTVKPIALAHDALLVKTEADNLFAAFKTTRNALQCAREIHKTLQQANKALPADWDVHVGIGIGFGPLLVLEGEDLFGSEMNLASKLGEDVAQAGQILLTEAAVKKLPALRRKMKKGVARFGVLTVPYFRVPGT